MIVDKPTYIVAELPDELAEWVKGVKQRFEPAIAHLPAEITLAGSSEVGPVLEGESFTEVAHETERTIKGKTDFSFRFLGIGNFEGTNIFFAEPECEGFNALHIALKASKIKFRDSPHPYNPHCSLKGFTALESGQGEALKALDIPKSEFQIKCISVYEMDEMQPQKWLSIPR